MGWSSLEQNLDRQLDLLRDYGVDRLYTEKMTGTKRDRPGLTRLLERMDAVISTGKLLFTIVSALAQFEQDVLADRTREGLKAARARGHFGGRPKTDPRKLQQAKKLYEAGQHIVRGIEELTGVKKATLSLFEYIKHCRGFQVILEASAFFFAMALLFIKNGAFVVLL